MVYHNLYDGVDLHIWGDAGATASTGNVLKYEFHVALGADYSQIQIRYDGIDSLCVDNTGDLRIATQFGTLTDSAPLVWQQPGPSRDKGSAPSRVSPSDSPETIPARFELVDEATHRFALDGPVDGTRTLIIDPDVEWMLVIGGGRDEDCWGVAIDGHESSLITGSTNSPTFEGRNNAYHGGWDAYIAKIDASGTLEWATYLGGGGFDQGRDIAADADDNVFITGKTTSTGFSGRNNEFHGRDDALPAKVNAGGIL